MTNDNPAGDRRMQKKTKRLIALSAIVGTIIAVGVTAAAGGGLFYVFQSQTDPFSTSASLEIRNLNALRNGDTLTVTATVKNTGQTSLTDLFIDRISVSDIEITQNADTGIVTLDHTDSALTQAYCLDTDASGCEVQIEDTKHRRGFSISDGQSTPEIEETTLEGGRTTAFKLVLTADGNPATEPTISNDVNISDQLTMTLQFSSGDDTLISDAYNTRVRSG